MCDAWKKTTKTELDILQIKEMFSKIKKIDAIRITGGEPFIREDILEIINYFTDRTSGIVHITSNGLLTDKTLDTIRETSNSKKIHLKISIDGFGQDNDKIRGVKGAFEKAIATVERLAQIKAEKGFYLAVNQTIVDDTSLDNYYKLKKLLDKLNVNLLIVIAYEKPALYDFNYQQRNYPGKLFKSFQSFNENELLKLYKILNQSEETDDFLERIVKRYYLKGLKNRIFKKKASPSPRCTSLTNHLRIFPNGDIPVCLYNSHIVGNLYRQQWRDIIKSVSYSSELNWVNNCQGCWAGCEVIPNAIYTGDIVKGLSSTFAINKTRDRGAKLGTGKLLKK